MSKKERILKRSVKYWTNHIIKKYGKKNALIFANSEYGCPCEALKWDCKDCKFSDSENPLSLCKDATNYTDFLRAYPNSMDNVIDRIKKKIKKEV